MLTVKETAKLTGVSVRTLHYYDEIGLLRPAKVTQAGYRLYGDAELSRLQQILFYRELEFPLSEIAALLDRKDLSRSKVLEQHRELLVMKRDRLSGLIALSERLMKGEQEMSFTEFDASAIEAQKEKYAQEARERWGDSQAYRDSQKKTDTYTAADWQAINGEMQGLFARFATCMEQGPKSAQAQMLVEEWKAFITDRFYHCTDEILAGLGQMYQEDERFQRNIDQTAPGLAVFIGRAVEIYCGKS